MKYFLSLVSLLTVGLPAAVFSFLGMDSFKQAEQNTRSQISPHIVRVKRVLLPRHVKLSGELHPFEQVEVISRLAGSVSELRVQAGDHVTAGALVAVVRSAELEERLGRQMASVGIAQNQLRARERESADAERLMTSRRELAQRELIPRRDVTEAEAAMETARASAELARAHLAQQQAMLAQVQALRALTRLTAPISGQVISRHVESGGPIAEGGAILTIGGLDDLRLAGGIGGAAALGLDLGAPARIVSAALPNQIFEGEVRKITSSRHETGQSIEVEVKIDNRRRQLRSGMMAEASVELGGPRNALFIPRTAVLSEHDSSFVYKTGAAGPVRQTVVVAAELGSEIVVVSGLTEGDQVVANVFGPNPLGAKTKEPPARQ